MANQSRYQPGRANRSGARDRDHDRDRFRERRRQFNVWYSSIYPAWPGYGYPYWGPGFYDWGDSDDSAYDQGNASPNYSAQYPDQDYAEPAGQETPPRSEPGQPSAAAQATMPEQSLTVIFKGGRAPAKMQNYMMTAKVLTDLDSRHYEQIPMDQIDIAATRQVNRAGGIDFQIPGTSLN